MDTQPQAAPTLSRKAFIFIIITAFLSSMGITLIAPVAPFIITSYISDTHSAGVTLGLLTSSYAICQFLAAPGLGALSDRYGRRPMLLLCLFGSAVGYLIFGLGGALWVLFVGRIIDGLTGGNISIAFAYIADITPPNERGKYFGWVGAVSGIGFILGPAIGGLTSKLGYTAPIYLAAAVTFANVLYGLLFMPESLPKAQRAEQVNIVRLNPFSVLVKIFAIPQFRWLLLASFLYTLPFAAMQSNIGLFLKDTLHWDADNTGVLYAMVGVLDILTQGVLLQRLLKHFGEAQVAIGGLCGEIVGFLLVALVAFVHSPLPLIIGVIIFAAGEALMAPSVGGLISRAAGARTQGQVQGGSQAVQSLARIGGPLLGGSLYDGVGHAAPYGLGAGVFLLAIGALRLALPALARADAQGEDSSVHAA